MSYYLLHWMLGKHDEARSEDQILSSPEVNTAVSTVPTNKQLVIIIVSILFILI
jgi:hypothetical protein